MNPPQACCPACGFQMMLVVRGDEPVAICPNHYCPDKFSDCCPSCQSARKNVRLAGMGATAFTCLDCGQAWETRQGVTRHRQGNIVTIHFNAKPHEASPSSPDAIPAPSPALPFRRLGHRR